jgi:hypothetical protein
MKNCWEILGINPTTDVQAIENARRILIENSNPAALTKDINAAFDRAMAFANAWKPVSRKPSAQVPSKNDPLKGNRTVLFLLGKPVGTGGSWWSR